MHEAETSFGILDLVQGVVETCSVPAGKHAVGEWMDLVAECSAAMTVLAAARDAAIVRLAAIESVVDEDGVLTEQVNGLGTQCVDAGAMVATAVGCAAGFAEEMVDQAITRVVRVPVLHQAMVAGGLDDYRARCVASELTDVPIDLARTVADAVEPDFATKSGPALRRRTRELLFRLSPDLLRERIRKARSRIGLRRWVGEPGTDSWGGSFPSERAATAWAAVDALARRYRAAGTHPTLEMARAYALLDLVADNATVKTVLHLTVPASATSDQSGDSAAADAEGGRTRVADDAAETGDGSRRSGRAGRRSRAGAEALSAVPTRRAAHRPAASRPASAGAGATGSASPDSASPGATSPDSASPDFAGRRDSAGAGATGSASPDSASPDSASPGAKDCGAGRAADPDASDRGLAFVGVSGVQGSSTTWMPWAALKDSTTVTTSSQFRVRLHCHPGTGALLDVDGELTSEAYVPGQRLKALVRQRDGRCRFPGCTVAARSCDIDHVQAWPRGPTAAFNLMCLCRRHHRVKQRHRWHVTLSTDGTVEWIDPRGRVHRTEPIDHLGVREPRVIADVGGEPSVVTESPEMTEPPGSAPSVVTESSEMAESSGSAPSVVTESSEMAESSGSAPSVVTESPEMTEPPGSAPSVVTESPEMTEPPGSAPSVVTGPRAPRTAVRCRLRQTASSRDSSIAEVTVAVMVEHLDASIRTGHRRREARPSFGWSPSSSSRPPPSSSRPPPPSSGAPSSAEPSPSRAQQPPQGRGSRRRRCGWADFASRGLAGVPASGPEIILGDELVDRYAPRTQRSDIDRPPPF